jgi:hypothetical protein
MSTLHERPAAWRRWLGIVLRTVHLVGVTMMGAALSGAPTNYHAGALLTLVSGVALLFSELADRRVQLGELAGVVVLLKLAVVTWIAFDERHALPLFWALLIVSAVVSHAPRGLRHWRVMR